MMSSAEHWLRCAHQEAASAIIAQLESSGVSPERAWALATASRADVYRVVATLGVPRLVAELDAPRSHDRASVLSRLQDEAARHHHAVSHRLTAELMPEGLARLPPTRPAGYDLTQLPRERLAEAIDLLETNGNPVSRPANERAADPLFATWFKALNVLGTRTLTMAEMNAMIRSDVEWDAGEVGLRGVDDFSTSSDPAVGVESVHELHKFLGGFRRLPVALGWLAGQGGEQGLFARCTGDLFGVGDDGWGSEAEIFKRWNRDIELRRSNNEMLQKLNLPDPVIALAEGSREQVLAELSEFTKLGYFADPREREAARPMVDTLLSTRPHSLQRVGAARSLMAHLSERARAGDTVSVSGATAEIQTLQTLYRYLNEHRLDVRNPGHTIDAAAVYRLYREMLARGELTTRATVESWLTHWQVPYEK
jgi:hypothetical protein